MGRFVSIAAICILTVISFAALPLYAQTNDSGMEKRVENRED
jgi:hypothetical protein